MINNMNNYTKVLILVSSLFPVFASHAEPGVSKDWIWSADGKAFYYALTVNSKKHHFGQYYSIDNARCFYMIGSDVECETDTAYPALVNSNNGAYNVTLKCAHENKG
jgi:hypothetical protein